jgi:hypothetical protein
MAIRNIRRQATNPLAAPGTPTSAPIYVDSDDNILKMIPAGSGSTEVQVVDASSAQTLTNKTLTSPTLTTPTLTNPAITGVAPVAYTTGTSLSLTAATHANRVVYVTDVASAYVLPLATGTGDKYTIILGATQTGAGTIKVANASDTFVGTAILFQDAGDTAVAFAAAATDDTVDLLGTANSTGGMIGAVYEFWDVASAKWAVRIVSDAGGTEATPFSATV